MSSKRRKGETRRRKRTTINNAIVTAHNDGKLGHSEQENERGIPSRREGATGRKGPRRSDIGGQREVRQVHRGAV